MLENTPGRSVFSTFAWTFNCNMNLKNSSVKISNYIERHCLDTFRSTILSKIGPDILSDNQRKTIVNSWERCLENNQMIINSGFPTVSCRK